MSRSVRRSAPVLKAKNASSVSTALVAELSHRGVDRRLKAVERLGVALRGQAAPRALISALQDPNELVRVEAAQSLAAIGDTRALRALWRTTHDRSPLVRSYVTAAIGVLGSDKDVKRLQHLVSLEGSDIARVGIYTALWSLGNTGALTKISELLGSKAYQVRCAAAETLAKFADRSNGEVIVNVLQQQLKKEHVLAARSQLRVSLKAVQAKLR